MKLDVKEVITKEYDLSNWDKEAQAELNRLAKENQDFDWSVAAYELNGKASVNFIKREKTKGLINE
jgi:hypothetical protein